MEKLFEIIHEDDQLVAINKPAGLVCHPTKTDVYSSLISRLRLYLEKSGTVLSKSEQTRGRLEQLQSRAGVPPALPDGEDRQDTLSRSGDTDIWPAREALKPHLIHRLDRETSGVVLVAKEDRAARELRRIWESRDVHKEYLAIVHGHLRVEQGVIDLPLGRDLHSAVAIKDCVRPDGASSQTEFHVIRRFNRSEGNFTLLRVLPRTGRKHQIRIHLAHQGHPVVGDKLYGGDENLYLDFVKGRLTAEQHRRLMLPNQALHAASLGFVWRDREWLFQAEPERCFADFAGAESNSKLKA